MASAQSTVLRLRPAQLAKQLGVQRQSLHELIERGVIERGADGLVDVELARHAIASRVRPSAKTAQALTTPNAAAAPDAANAPSTFDPSATTSYHVAKTIREATEAKIAQLRLAQMKGDLIDREQVRRAAFSVLRTVRDQLLAVPARLAPLLCAETDPASCYALLDTELRQVLAHLQQLPGIDDEAPA